MTPPPTAPSSDEDGGGRSLSVATSRAGLGGGEEGTSWTAPPSVDGVAIDRFGEGDEKSTTQQRRTSSSVVVPPLPLGKPEVVAPSSALPPVSVRRKNSFVAKLVASWQFAQRKRLRRQGEREREVFFLFWPALVFSLPSLSHAREPFPFSPSLSFSEPNQSTNNDRRARLSGIRHLGAALLRE